MRFLVLPILLALAGVAGAARAQTIDTRNGDRMYGATSEHFGQTFTAPAGAAFLHAFSFFVYSNGDTHDAVYRGVLRAWDGGPTGPVLYASEQRVANTCCTPLEAQFLAGSVPVVPGNVYVAYIEQLAGSLAHTLPGDGLEDFADSYAGGTAIGGLCQPDPTSCTWYAQGFDREFVAQLSAAATVAPEPGTATLLGGGLAIAALARRRRTRSGARVAG